MSISISNITKKYGSQIAVDDVSFDISSGEVIGFIGPNGAGKSTLMKILTGYLGADSGTAVVAGYDVTKDPLEVKKSIGYLPEHNPLYLEMYVREYLRFVAGLHHLKGNVKERISTIIEQTGLTPESHKKIGKLSKGYRQRVGIAQALLHDPQVLILDEPTTGLDPNQIVEIRNLISGISKEKTVMLSTHIMQEVEAICDRILIINKGKIVADEKTGTIKQSAATNEQTVVVEFSHAVDKEPFLAMDGVDKVLEVNPLTLLIRYTGQEDVRASIFKVAVIHEYPVVGLHKKEKSLEEVFRELTGK